MTEANKKVVLEYVEAFNRADMEALRRLFTEDALVYGVLGRTRFRRTGSPDGA